ncbi:MAG: site-specific integrase [Campylobacterota bacterium]|nr:site-specific integrase [Campylobacterota bacterium]
MAQFTKSKKFTGVTFSTLKNGDKSYYITYKLNGKVTRIHIGKQSEGINEAFCHQKRNDAINKVKFGEDSSIVRTKKKSILFTKIADEYFKYSEIHNKGHYNQLKSFQKHIEPFLKDLTVDEVTLELIETMQQKKLKILAPKTVNHLTQSIGTIFNYAINRELIKIKNPLVKLKKIVLNNHRLRYLNVEEINLLFDKLKDNEQLFLFAHLALNTGARLHTIINIKKKDIDFYNKTVTLTDFKNDTNYKAFLNDTVIELLKHKVTSLKENDSILLYSTRQSNLGTYLSKKMKPIFDELFNQELDLKDTQNRVVTHTLRHTFASHLAINGTPIFTIQKLMNHKDINMTMRYAKLAPDSGRNFVNDLYK